MPNLTSVAVPGESGENETNAGSVDHSEGDGRLVVRPIQATHSSSTPGVGVFT